MSAKPGDYDCALLTTSNFIGAPTNYDSGSLGFIVVHCTASTGAIAVDATVVPTVTTLGAGEYIVTWQTPSGYAAGDTLIVLCSWLVAGNPYSIQLPSYVLDSQRLYDITAGSVNVRAIVEAYLSGQDPATIVLGAPSSSWTAAGTIGALLNLISTINSSISGLAASVWAYATRTLSAFGFGVTVATNSDKTGYALTTAEHTAISGTDVPAGLTAQGYTTARAAKLDDLDATISSRSTFAGGSVASVTAPVTVGTNNDKSGYSLATAPPTASQNATAAAAAILVTPANKLATDGSGNPTIGGNVTVGGYAAGEDPATLILNAVVPSSGNTAHTIAAILDVLRTMAVNGEAFVGNDLIYYEDDNVTQKLTFTLTSTTNPGQPALNPTGRVPTEIY